MLRRAVGAGAAALVAGGMWLPDNAMAGNLDDGTGEDQPTISNLDPLRTEALALAPLARFIPAPNLHGVGAPPIVTRRQWGADETIRVNERSFAPIRKIIVHHTASENRPRDPASVVRFTQRYHTVTRGYTDIGYNYMIDHRGVIYEGRYARRYGDEPITAEDHNGWGVVGGHAKNTNAGTCGICLIGNFDQASPTDAALSSLGWLIAWKASRHRIDVTDTDPYYSVYREWRSFPNLSGHRNVGQTECPGTRLYRALPALRSHVAGQAGHWSRLVVDLPVLLRYEFGVGQGPLSAAADGGFGNSGSSGSGGSSSNLSSGSTGTLTKGTKPVGYRVVTTAGQVLTAGGGARLGSPSQHGAGSVVALSSPGWGEAYAAVTSAGHVLTYGGIPSVGDAAGKGTAVDLAVTPSGLGYWILMRDGGIYPFGDAKYFGSPKRSGLTSHSVKMAVPPRGDGYWVLTADGKVHNFGAAAALGSPTFAGAPVDIAAVPSGVGYFVLSSTGEVAGYGNARSHGGPSGSMWKRPATAITTMPVGGGYVVSARDGALYSFGGAPYFGTFAGSGATVAGLVVASH